MSFWTRRTQEFIEVDSYQTCLPAFLWSYKAKLHPAWFSKMENTEKLSMWSSNVKTLKGRLRRKLHRHYGWLSECPGWCCRLPFRYSSSLTEFSRIDRALCQRLGMLLCQRFYAIRLEKWRTSCLLSHSSIFGITFCGLWKEMVRFLYTKGMWRESYSNWTSKSVTSVSVKCINLCEYYVAFLTWTKTICPFFSPCFLNLFSQNTLQLPVLSHPKQVTIFSFYRSLNPIQSTAAEAKIRGSFPPVAKL